MARLKGRVYETDHGIQGVFTVEIYDQMQKRFRDRGWLETKDILTSGIRNGLVLEIGPGPGYLGLEWLNQTEGTVLKGLEISPDMIALAERNARDYGLSDRVEYKRGSGAPAFLFLTKSLTAHSATGPSTSGRTQRAP